MEITVVIFVIIAIITYIGLVFGAQKDDPCYKCPVYKYESCSYVDGPYCNMKDCEILEKFNQTHVVADA